MATPWVGPTEIAHSTEGPHPCTSKHHCSSSVDVREVWPAPPTLAVSSALDSAGCAGFVSGVPVVTANLTEPLAALHFVATGPDGLLLEGPDGRVTCAPRSGSTVALAVHTSGYRPMVPYPKMPFT